MPVPGPSVSPTSRVVRQSRLATAGSVKSGDITLVASDHRFLRSANLAGLHTLDPATFPAGDVPALFDL